jgi:hypothetical protein
MRPRRKIADQVLVVVGATTGVGRATVSSALAHGARVAAVATDAAALDALRIQAAAPHRFEPIVVDGPFSAQQVVHVTTSRFGLIHTWVHIAGRTAADAPDLAQAGTVALPQLRRAGGGTFVAVTSAPVGQPSLDPYPWIASRAVAEVRAALNGRPDLAAVTEVVRSGVTSPDEVAAAILRSAIRPRTEVVVHGPPRWLSLVAPVQPRPDGLRRALDHRRPRISRGALSISG